MATAKKGLGFSLNEQLGFYAQVGLLAVLLSCSHRRQYHNNNINIFIHTCCVPTILWTAIVFTTATGPLLPVPEAITEALPPILTNHLEFNLGFFGMLYHIQYHL